jgi:hypothetical protein
MVVAFKVETDTKARHWVIRENTILEGGTVGQLSQSRN